MSHLIVKTQFCRLRFLRIHRSASFSGAYYGGANGIIIVFDVTNAVRD
jgi:GTPase SAR1 family protein